MKKTILFIICIIMATNIYGQTLYKYDIEVVKSFESGDDITQLGLIETERRMGDDNEPYAPRSLCFDYNGRLNILDSFNKRLVMYNDKFIGFESINVSSMLSSGHLEHYENYIVSTNGNWACSIYDKKSNTEIDVRMLDSLRNKNRYSFIFTGDIVFSKIDNDKFVSFVYPGDSYLDNIRNVLYEEDTLKLFNEPDKYNLEDYTYKDGYILYKGNHIITSFKDYYNYWDKFHKENNMLESSMVIGLNRSHNELGNLAVSFIGQDKNGFTFWQVGRSMFIFDDNGWVYDYFKVPKKLEPTTMWTLSPEGDLYALKLMYEDRKHQLLRINKQW